MTASQGAGAIRSPDTNGATAPLVRRGGRRSQRAEILDAAVDLFAKGGSRGTSLAAIAQKIGVTVPAITHHFGTKHNLFVEVVGITDQIDETRLTPSEARNGLEQLSGMRAWAGLLTSDPGLANLTRLSLVMRTEAMDVDYPAHDHFVERDRYLRGRTIQVIEAGQRDGSIRPDVDPFTSTVEILAFVQGAVRQWLLDPESIDLVGVFDQYFDRIMRDCAA